MNSLELNTVISDLFREKIPRKSNAVNTLSEILDIDKKSVYRRLNSEVFFSFSEICKISLALGISLDNIVRKELRGLIPNGFILQPSSESSWEIIAEVICRIRLWATNISLQPFSELGSVYNSIPIPFCALDKEILQYYYYYMNCMKRDYSFAQMKDDRNFIHITDALFELSKEYLNMGKYILS